jgi:hypothetical protein
MDRRRVVETVLLVRLRPTELVVPVIYCNCVDQSNGREVSDITRCKGSNYIIIFCSTDGPEDADSIHVTCRLPSIDKSHKTRRVR